MSHDDRWVMVGVPSEPCPDDDDEVDAWVERMVAKDMALIQQIREGT